jgi:hypothetical protein
MPEVTLNSFATDTEQLPYVLPQNIQPQSTIASPMEVPRGQIKMQFRIDSPEQADQPFGTHLREAAGIVREWMHSK